MVMDNEGEIVFNSVQILIRPIEGVDLVPIKDFLLYPGVKVVVLY